MKKNKVKIKAIPDFKSEDEEREFWNNNDSTDIVDWSKAERISFPNLKPATQSMSDEKKKKSLKN